MQDPDFALRASLPVKPKRILELPPVDDAARAVHATDFELPVVLAIWLFFSVSEIRGIQVSAIHDGFITIQESVVQVEGRAVSKKGTKEYERTRKHALTPYLMTLIEQTTRGRTEAAISKRVQEKLTPADSSA